MNQADITRTDDEVIKRLQAKNTALDDRIAELEAQLREARAAKNDKSQPAYEPLRRSLTFVLNDVIEELQYAIAAWPPYNSAHEGFAVMLEEVDELKVHVWQKQKTRDLVSMKREAIQIAAVALRFAAEVCSEERGRK